MSQKGEKKSPTSYGESPAGKFMPSEKKYNVRYRFNGSTEVYVGSKLLKFEAHKMNPVLPSEYANGVPASIVNHPDFQTQKKYFAVTEIQGG